MFLVFKICLYKFKFLDPQTIKCLMKKGRVEGYKLSYLGNLIQKFLLKFFPDSFCNIYVAIVTK